jgi:hypothetical protein
MEEELEAGEWVTGGEQGESRQPHEHGVLRAQLQQV